MQKKTVCKIALVCVAATWGGGFPITKIALDSGMAPNAIMSLRFLIASLLIFLFLFIKKVKITKAEMKLGLGAGLVLGTAFSLQTVGLMHTTSSKNAFITGAYVVCVPFMLWILTKKRPKWITYLSSIICFTGIGFLSLDGDLSMNYGDVLTLICAFFFATHMIVLERYSRHCDAIVMTALQMLGAGILSTICALLFETPPAQFELSAVGNLAYLIFISTLLAYLLQTFAQRFTTANSASLILSMEALFATLFSFLFLHEELTLYMIFGAALIFCSVIYIEYKPKQHT